MALPRFSESTAKRLAWGLTLLWLLFIAAALLNASFGLVAASVGFAAGIWMGRLTEARESAKGNGVILGK